MIGKLIRTMRKKANLSQKELSKMCNIAISTLSGYESGYREPTFEMIEKISKACGYEVLFKNIKNKETLTIKNINREEI